MKIIFGILKREIIVIALFTIFGLPLLSLSAQVLEKNIDNNIRQCISINNNWRFFKYDSMSIADSLIYDVRPDVKNNEENKPADTKPTEAKDVKTNRLVLKPWILPIGNDFIKDPAMYHVRPEGNPGSDFPIVQKDFNDSSWEVVNLPHDWAIKGPFYKRRIPRDDKRKKL